MLKDYLVMGARTQSISGELFGLIFSMAFVAGVIGNLVANFIQSIPLHRKMNKHHAIQISKTEALSVQPKAGSSEEICQAQERQSEEKES